MNIYENSLANKGAATLTAAFLLLVLSVAAHCALAGESTNNRVTAWGPATNGCQLGVELAKTNFIAREPIQATIRLRNLGRTVFGYTGTKSPFDFGITLLDADGKQIRRKSDDPTGFFGEELDRSGSYRWIALTPGEELELEMRLDAKFALVPGQYTISFRHVLANANWTNRFSLASDSVQFRVAP